jgi:nitroreductase
MNFLGISELIHRRRSIFPATYTGEKVDDDIIQKILENANQAPSHKNTEPWRFHVFCGERLKELSKFFQNTYQEKMITSDFSEVKYNKLGKNPLMSSHVIAICMQRDSSQSIPEWEEMAAVACAVQNIYLSVTAAELGGYWSSPDLMIENIGDFIQLEKEEKCFGFFYIGVPIKGIELNVVKKPLKEKVKWYR